MKPRSSPKRCFSSHFPQLRKWHICCPVVRIRNFATIPDYFLFLFTRTSLKSNQNLYFTLFPNRFLYTWVCQLLASPLPPSSAFHVLPERWVMVAWWGSKDSSRSPQNYFYILTTNSTLVIQNLLQANNFFSISRPFFSGIEHLYFTCLMTTVLPNLPLQSFFLLKFIDSLASQLGSTLCIQ